MLQKQAISPLSVFTSFSSVSKPLMLKYKKPPVVNARHSFMYTCPKIEPTAVPASAPIAVRHYSPTIWHTLYLSWKRIAKSPTSWGISWKNMAMVVTSPIL